MLLEIAFAMTPRERRTVVIYVSYLEQISSFTMCITKVPVSYTAKQWFQFSWLLLVVYRGICGVHMLGHGVVVKFM